MVAIKAEIRKENQERIVCGHMRDSLLGLPRNKWGPMRFETYLDGRVLGRSGYTTRFQEILWGSQSREENTSH